MGDFLAKYREHHFPDTLRSSRKGDKQKIQKRQHHRQCLSPGNGIYDSRKDKRGYNGRDNST